jgi:hypothetical protein
MGSAAVMLSEALRSQREWTLALDESGSFETGSDDRVVGGVLLPGNAERSDAALGPFRKWCDENISGSLHASEQSDVSAKERLRQAAARAVEECGGLWVFVVADRRDPLELRPSLASYVRLLAATVDLAGRVAASFGVQSLHLRPAQRTTPLVKEAQNRGLIAASPTREGKGRAMSEAEVRGVLEALAREAQGDLLPIPAAASVRADSANTYVGAHRGLLLADIGCNAIYNALALREKAPLATFVEPFAPVILVPQRATSSLRAIDRALRESPAALVRAANLVSVLEANSRGRARNVGDKLALRQGAESCAELIWAEGLRQLVQQGDATARLYALAAQAEVELGRRSGSYEGLARAIDAGWSGQGELATAHRSRLSNRPLAARLWRLTLECANHCGDLATARQSFAAFDATLAAGQSLRLLAEEFEFRNLATVGLQNALPCASEEVASVTTALESQTQALLDFAERARRLVAAPGKPSAPALIDSSLEDQLWSAGVGTEPAWLEPDRELGMTLGTCARSWAFAGRLEDATRTIFAARARFGDSPSDLAINAAHIARIELERARIDPKSAMERRPVLAAALALCGADAFARGPANAPDLNANPGARFAFDIALRALLWAPKPPFPADRFLSWLSDAEFTASWTRGALRSHPSELMARHGAELTRARKMNKASQLLFDLSLDLCSAAAPDSTLARFIPFTQRLRDDPTFQGEGPLGSVLNPSFEYR